MVAPLLPYLMGSVTAFLPAASSFLAATTKGSAGVAQIVEKKLRSWEDKEFAMRERVRSRMHLVFVLRPCVEGAHPTASTEISEVEQSSQSLWSRFFRQSGDNKCEIGGYTLTCPAEPQTNKNFSLGEGAERHEMVLCKSQGYVCVDYKGMLYRMIDQDGKVMPGGLKAIRLNVLYDLLRAAAQSGEFSVGQAALPLAASKLAPGSSSAVKTRVPLSRSGEPATAGSALSRTAHTLVKGAEDSAPPSSAFVQAQTEGLSEAMGAWSKLRMRAEMHCMRGDAVMFATYSDTEFTRDQMMTGVNLHSMGKVDEDNPYCAFVTKKMNALVAQGEILSVADLHSASATSSATPEEESNHQASHPKSMAECYKSFSRIRDITELSTQFSKSVMPWLGKLSISSSTGTTAASLPKK